MARHQKTPLKIIGILGIALAVFTLLGGGIFLFLKKQDGFSDLPPFPIDTYLSGGNLWSYDDYRIEGRVDNVIYRSQSSDRFVASIQPMGSKIRLPIVIEKGPGMKSVQLEQELAFKVTLGQGQEILCREYKPR
ncbi:MAG TPA: hypothetical protein PLA50_07380 [Bacteroidia bacterium]|nr:hypothetical protein [Bacteroidia bacterium]